jgi:uncharacterized membrane protein
MNINIDQIKAKAYQKANTFIANIKSKDFAKLALEISFIAYFTLKIAAMVIWQNRQQVKKTIETVIAILMLIAVVFAAVAMVIWQNRQEIIKQAKKTVVNIIESLLEAIAILMILAISLWGVVNYRIIPVVKQWILKIDQQIQFYLGAG